MSSCRVEVTRNAGLLPRAFERGGVGIAERHELHVRTKGQPGQMILQRDAAAANDGDIEVRLSLTCWREYGAEAGKLK